MEKPTISPEARDEATMRMAELGMIGRIRLKLSNIAFFIGTLLLPRSFREAFGDMKVDKEEE